MTTTGCGILLLAILFSAGCASRGSKGMAVESDAARASTDTETMAGADTSAPDPNASGNTDLDEAFDYYKELQILFATEDLGLIFTAQKRFTCAIYDHIGNGHVCAEAGAVYGGGIAELVFIRPD